MEDNRLVKEVVFGKMEVKTKRGRPKREWLGNIKEWCNKEISILKRKAQDRDTWEKIVKSCALAPTGDEPKEHWMDIYTYIYYKQILQVHTRK